MYMVYGNRCTPAMAFLEGMVRVFDWAALWGLRKARKGLEADSDRPSDRQVVDTYVRESIAAFEIEEADALAGEPSLTRRSFVIADVLLGPPPNQDVILRYEAIVPGSAERIMERACQRLDHDCDAELKLFKDRARQGYKGMTAGFILALLLAGGALALLFTGNSWPGISLVAFILLLGIAASVYVTKAKVRQKYFSEEFFFGNRRRRKSAIR